MPPLKDIRAAIAAKKQSPKPAPVAIVPSPVVAAPAKAPKATPPPKPAKPRKEVIPDELFASIIAGPEPMREIQRIVGKYLVSDEQMKKVPRTPRKRKLKEYPDASKGRLPMDSEFICKWNGERWSVFLVIPGTPNFHAHHSALFRGLAAVDGFYRAWQASQEKPAEPADSACDGVPFG